MTEFRARVRSWPGGALLWRLGVTVVGVAIIVGGVILLPLPGPGWLIIFGGLGVLATEYAWAARLLGWVRGYVRRWVRWVADQPLWGRVVAGAISLLAVAAIVAVAWFVVF